MALTNITLIAIVCLSILLSLIAIWRMWKNRKYELSWIEQWIYDRWKSARKL